MPRLPAAVRGRGWGERARATLNAGPLARAGLHLARRDRERVLPRDYTGPVPEWEALPPEAFTAPRPMPGLAHWDPRPGLALLQGALHPGLAAYERPALPAAARAQADGYHSYFHGLDAAALHALVRHVRPARVVELGSGVSTLVLDRALRENAAEGRPAELRVHDPYPRPVVTDAALIGAVRPTAAEDLPDAAFADLRHGDVLFVDTSHHVRLGGDVTRILLEVLPGLRAGVLVHVHDVLLPYPYHRQWYERGWYWTEQYLLQALLIGDASWEVVLAHHHLHREHAGAVAALPGHLPGSQPSSLWLRRRPADEDAGRPLADRLPAPG